MVTVSDVVASLTLGFWADILHYEMYDQMWRECTHKAFPNRPKGTRRGSIAPAIKRLKNLRNRVAHHEPIFHLPLVQEHKDVTEISWWICPVTSAWVARHSRFNDVWTNQPG